MSKVGKKEEICQFCEYSDLWLALTQSKELIIDILFGFCVVLELLITALKQYLILVYVSSFSEGTNMAKIGIFQNRRNWRDLVMTLAKSLTLAFFSLSSRRHIFNILLYIKCISSRSDIVIFMWKWVILGYNPRAKTMMTLRWPWEKWKGQGHFFNSAFHTANLV